MVVNTLHLLTGCLVFGGLTAQMELVDSIIFRSVGIKLCQFKCIQFGCRGIRYNLETQTCHLSARAMEMISSENEHDLDPSLPSDVKAGNCTLKTCRGMRCLETHAGKTVCVKDKHYQSYNRGFLNITLIDACSRGDLRQVKYILSQDPTNVNTRGQSGRTPAMIAALTGHIAVLELLVEKGANLSLLDDDDHNILHVACTGGHVETVTYVLNQNCVDINSKDCKELTPLLLAAYHGKREIFHILVQKGADLLVVDMYDNNILHLACRGGHVEMVKSILTQKLVDTNSKGYKGMSTVLLSAFYGKREVFDFLVKQGADLSVVDKNGDNVLHLACRGGNVEIVKYVLTQKLVDINSKGYRGMSPVLHSVYYGKREVFDFLVKQGADLSIVVENGDNILHLACQRGDMKIVNYTLTQTNVDINSRNGKMKTPLLTAAYNGERDVLDLLIAAGADVSAVDDKWRNMLHLSSLIDHVNIVKYILNLTVVDINSEDKDRMTPVMLAAYSGNREIFDILVKKGAELSGVNTKGNNILHNACIGEDDEIVKRVLGLHIVDINCRGFHRMTPVLYAAKCRSCDVLQILLEGGADPLVVNTDGDNILHLACRERNVEIVKYVLSQSIVDITMKNKKGLNATMVARKMGNVSIAVLLSQTSQPVRG